MDPPTAQGDAGAPGAGSDVRDDCHECAANDGSRMMEIPFTVASSAQQEWCWLQPIRAPCGEAVAVTMVAFLGPPTSTTNLGYQHFEYEAARCSPDHGRARAGALAPDLRECPSVVPPVAPELSQHLGGHACW